MDKEIKIDFVWLICYINSENIGQIERDIAKRSIYKNIDYYIPKVKILTKQFKGKNFYQEVPLLFNYGFFKIPVEKAKDKEFLRQLKQDVPCIYAWLKDPTNPHKVAIASFQEIINLVEESTNKSIYSQLDLDRVKPGVSIILKGYPFDNMEAKVLDINHAKKEVKVSLVLGNLLKEVKVSFDNVFYSIYHGGFDDTIFKEKYLEDISGMYAGALDKLLNNPNLISHDPE